MHRDPGSGRSHLQEPREAIPYFGSGRRMEPDATGPSPCGKPRSKVSPVKKESAFPGFQRWHADPAPRAEWRIGLQNDPQNTERAGSNAIRTRRYPCRGLQHSESSVERRECRDWVFQASRRDHGLNGAMMVMGMASCLRKTRKSVLVVQTAAPSFSCARRTMQASAKSMGVSA